MTYAERALPSNAGVQFADREPDIALDAHGLWPYKPEARRDLKHVDLQLFESWAPQADPAATWRRLGFVQPSRHRADVVPETTPRRRRTDAGLRFMMYIAASPTSSATRPQLNPCDHLCRWPRGATFTPRRHQRNSPSVAATCSIDRSTRMTGRKRTSQRTSAAAFAVPRETPPSRRARTSRGHVELDGHALGPTGSRTPSPRVGFTVERRRARPPPNQARAPTTLRANLRRTSHSHYISDAPPPPKPRAPAAPHENVERNP